MKMNVQNVMASAADWQAECVETLLRANPKTLLAASAFPGMTQYELPFDTVKAEDDFHAFIQIPLLPEEESVFEGIAKTKKQAELAAAEAASIELNRRGLLHHACRFMGWNNPKQFHQNSGLYAGKSLPVTFTSSGPAHSKVFEAELLLPLKNEVYTAVGKAKSKSEAEKICCSLACKRLVEESLIKQSDTAAHIHQQNELPTVLEVSPALLAKLKDAVSRLQEEYFKEISDNMPESSALPKPPERNDCLTPSEVKEKSKAMEKEAAKREKNLIDCIEHRKQLPIWADKEKILTAVLSNRVIVLTGDTGSGKSTQVPQFILEEAEMRGVAAEVNIVVTQPRRIAAISLAERVAWERGEKVGNTVGYSIRLENAAPKPHGSILFCTAGLLLWRLQELEAIADISHIVIDEAHERDIATDCLLTIVRDLMKTRPSLRVIIMSATLDASIFTRYFNDCPHISTPGKSYPVKVYFRDELQQLMGQEYVEEEDDDKSDVNCDFAASVISWITNKFAQAQGAILCFLPGWATIMKLKERLLRTGASKNMIIIPFHSQLSASEQRLAFSHAPSGMRKVVLATNIAETSVTIDDVVYVVDSGKIKMKQFRPVLNMATLKMQWTSQACALQRQGRAGRVQPGFCFRLYTRTTFENMLEHQKPEMQRSPLEELCLQIKALIMPSEGISAFLLKTIEPPAECAIMSGLNMLKQLGAIDETEKLTPLGNILSKLAVDPRYGKAMVYGMLLGCGDVLTVAAAAACFKDPFVLPVDRKKEAQAVKLGFATGSYFGSDQLAMIRLFQKYSEAEYAGLSSIFCETNFVSPVVMKLISGMRNQFQEILAEHILMGHTQNLSAYEEALHLARCVLVCGLSPNIARSAMCKESKGSKRISHRWRLGFTVDTGRVLSHPLSIIDEKNWDARKHYYMVFDEKVRSTQAFVRGCNLVPPLALVIFCADVIEKQELTSKPGWTVLQTDSWLDLHIKKEAGTVLMKLREVFNTLIRRWLQGHSRSDAEVELVQVVKELLVDSVQTMLSAHAGLPTT